MFTTKQYSKCLLTFASSQRPHESTSRKVPSISATIAIAVACLTIAGPLPVWAQSGAPMNKDLRLVGSHPLQARSAYQIHPHRYPDGRYILFVGHHSDQMPNPWLGKVYRTQSEELVVD